MVLEQFIDRRVVLRHFSFAFFLTFLYVFVAFVAQVFFFPGQSIALVLLIALLLVPSIHHLIMFEEKIESGESKHFFAHHRGIVRNYLAAFCGIMAGCLVLGLLVPNSLSYESGILQTSHLNVQNIDDFRNNYHASFGTALGVFTNNVQFIIIGFL